MRLINEDVFNILPSMESASVDITFTSVPFKPEDMGLTKGEYWEQMDCLYRELIRITSKAIFIIQSASNIMEQATICPECGTKLIHMEGCLTCPVCW